MRKIRVLGIAPYDGMKNLMAHIVVQFPQIELTTFVGDLNKGLEIAQENFHGNFDLVISRGATANLLRSRLVIPVIGVEISLVDILCALQLAKPDKEKIAIVSFADVNNTAKQLCDLIGYKLDCYTIPSVDEAEDTLILCKKKGYHAILCDVIADTIARELGLNSFLITSGTASIMKAFESALFLSEAQHNLKTENILLRNLFASQVSYTVVFDSMKQLYLTSVEEVDTKIIDMLRQEIDEVLLNNEKKVTRIRNGMIYIIRAKKITLEGNIYIAFFYTERKCPLPVEKAGITCLSSSEIKNEYFSSLFAIAGSLSLVKNKTDKLTALNIPVIIYGEQGTGKLSLAQYLHLNGPWKNNSFVLIDCRIVNEKSWDFLINHTASPLASLNQTIFFSNINFLNPSMFSDLLASVNEISLKNQLILSCICNSDNIIPADVKAFANKLSAVTINTPPLREQKENIPQLFNRALSLLNMDISHPLAGATEKAVELLKNFPWPDNFSQFIRVSKEIAISSDNSIADEELVRNILKKEESQVYLISSYQTSTSIPINQSLKEIERMIAIKVLEESNGNQTLAARRLQISRTTLWRMLSR